MLYLLASQQRSIDLEMHVELGRITLALLLFSKTKSDWELDQSIVRVAWLVSDFGNQLRSLLFGLQSENTALNLAHTDFSPLMLTPYEILYIRFGQVHTHDALYPWRKSSDLLSQT